MFIFRGGSVTRLVGCTQRLLRISETNSELVIFFVVVCILVSLLFLHCFLCPLPPSYLRTCGMSSSSSFPVVKGCAHAPSSLSGKMSTRWKSPYGFSRAKMVVEVLVDDEQENQGRNDAPGRGAPKKTVRLPKIISQERLQIRNENCEILRTLKAEQQ